MGGTASFGVLDRYRHTARTQSVAVGGGAMIVAATEFPHRMSAESPG
ncbi:hypothetical protein ACTD5D_18980 [Nocardia takedensis]